MEKRKKEKCIGRAGYYVSCLTAWADKPNWENEYLNKDFMGIKNPGMWISGEKTSRPKEGWTQRSWGISMPWCCLWQQGNKCDQGRESGENEVRAIKGTHATQGLKAVEGLWPLFGVRFPCKLSFINVPLHTPCHFFLHLGGSFFCHISVRCFLLH